MLVKCGCNQHFVRTDDTYVVSWRGETWSSLCAFKETARIIDVLQDENKLKNIIQKCLCGLCAKPIGAKYHLHGDCLYCEECVHDIGGEG